MASTVTAMPSTRMSEAEWQTRLDLAACYRLVDLFEWSDLVNTRITARVPGQQDHFLINPYGLLFDEITASSLVKIDAKGNKVEPSESEINSGGFAIPSTIHMARPEVAYWLPADGPGAFRRNRAENSRRKAHAGQRGGPAAGPRQSVNGRQMRLVGLREIERQLEPAIASSGGIETNQDIAKHHFSSPCHPRRDTTGECWPESARSSVVGQPGSTSASNQRSPVFSTLP
jgi:hypothetical protein